MRIIESSRKWKDAFDSASGGFDFEKWKEYADTVFPGLKELCLNDMESCINATYTWETDYVSVIEAVRNKSKEVDKAVNSFRLITDSLDGKVSSVFGKTVDVDIILYLGLCNGAGWATTIAGKDVILLGIEKIIELDWTDVDTMNGLILHELGHIYQKQYGTLKRDFSDLSDIFLWQLFTEGVAMSFEQKTVGNDEYFHQNKSGWKEWCDTNKKTIAESFVNDLYCMTNETQRYFGDWVYFHGYSETGYYLGTRFVQFILKFDVFDNIINFDIFKVRKYFNEFIYLEVNQK